MYDFLPAQMSKNLSHLRHGSACMGAVHLVSIAAATLGFAISLCCYRKTSIALSCRIRSASMRQLMREHDRFIVSSSRVTSFARQGDVDPSPQLLRVLLPNQSSSSITPLYSPYPTSLMTSTSNIYRPSTSTSLFKTLLPFVAALG